MKLRLGPEDEAFRAELERLPRRAHAARSARPAPTSWASTRGDELVPQWMRDMAGDAVRPRLDDPGYPPELGGRNCTPVQTLIYLETLASRRIPRSGHFPGYAIVAPSLLEFGNDAQQALAPAADPRRHDLVHRHERAERGLRPRRPADARRGVRRPLRRQRPEGVDVVRADRAEVLLLRAHRSDRRRSTRASRC